MDIYFKKTDEAACLEFVGFYEKKLSEYMDPFRRCRAGNFDAKALEPFVIEAFDAYSKGEKTIKLNELFAKTNALLDEYYRQTSKEIAIAPDIFAHRNEVEDELKRLIEKKLALEC